jgi:hypothetical protein
MSLTKASYAMINGAPINVLDYGAVADGNYSTGAGTDNTTAFANALASLSTSGGTALYIPSGIYKVSSQLSIPDAVSIVGDGPWSSIIFCPNAFSTASGLLKIGGTASGYPTQISNLAVLAQAGGCTGSAIVSNKNGVFINNVWVSGFNLGIDFNQTDNFLTNFIVELCTLGIRVTQSDVNISNGSVYACNDGALVSNAGAVGSGAVSFSAIRASSCLFTGFVIDSAKSVQLVGCSAYHDNASKFVTAGLSIVSSSRVSVDGFQAYIPGGGHTTGIGIKCVNAASLTITGGVCQGWLDGVQTSGAASSNIEINGLVSLTNSRHGINIQGGDKISVVGCQACFVGAPGGSDSGILSNNSDPTSQHIIVGNIVTQSGGGNQEYGINANITDNTATTIISNNSCLFNSTADIIVQGQTQNILLSNNVFNNLTDLAGHPSVASASQITIPAGVTAVKITGTTQINAINVNSSTRKTVTLIFEDVLTVADGGNLKLAGNFVTTADDTLTLYCDGTDWYEVARSVN